MWFSYYNFDKNYLVKRDKTALPISLNVGDGEIYLLHIPCASPPLIFMAAYVEKESYDE